MVRASREKKRFMISYWRGIDALLTGGAFTHDAERLACFADVSGICPGPEDFTEAGNYLGWFLTTACDLPNIREVRVYPMTAQMLGVEVTRIVNGKPLIEKTRYTFKNRRMLPPPDETLQA